VGGWFQGMGGWVDGCVGGWVGLRVGFINMPFYFINLWLMTDRHRYCTYLYYLGHIYIHIDTQPRYFLLLEISDLRLSEPRQKA
jgi:hypothetical protein